MNCSEAKLVSILDVCEHLGGQKAKVNYDKSYALFHATYREDKHPSLLLNLRTNRWRDLATGQSGDSIDLIMLTNYFNTKDALAYLAGIYRKSKNFTAGKKKEVANAVIKALTHPALLSYVTSRGIAPDVAQKFCYEAHWTNNGKCYFAVAFPSISGGYEIRNPYFKGCLGAKDISVIGKGDSFFF